jgi:tetratricopeptide (TPR) repeat protein
MEKGDHERAAPFLEEALALSRTIGDKRNTAGTLHNLGEVERQRGNYEQAKALGMESMALWREIEDDWNLSMVVGWVGLLEVWSGDEPDLAEGFLKDALALERELGNWAYGAYCLEAFAGLAGARGQGARAARLWGRRRPCVLISVRHSLPMRAFSTSPAWMQRAPNSARRRGKRRSRTGWRCPPKRLQCMPLQKATVPDWTTSMGNGADSVADTPRVQGPLRPEGAGRVTTSGTRGSEAWPTGWCWWWTLTWTST